MRPNRPQVIRFFLASRTTWSLRHDLQLASRLEIVGFTTAKVAAPTTCASTSKGSEPACKRPHPNGRCPPVPRPTAQSARRYRPRGSSRTSMAAEPDPCRTVDAPRARRLERDHLLRQLWTFHPSSRLLALALRRYGACAWPREQHLPAPPQGCSAERRLLWLIHRFDLPVPGTGEGVRKALLDVPPTALPAPVAPAPDIVEPTQDEAA